MAAGGGMAALPHPSRLEAGTKAIELRNDTGPVNRGGLSYSAARFRLF